MIHTIAAHSKRIEITLLIKALYPFTLGIHLYDPQKPNTYFFRRKAQFQSDTTREFQIRLPVSSYALEMDVFDKNSSDDTAFEIIDISAKQMQPPKVWASDSQHNYLKFAIDFAKKAGYTDTGFYQSSDGEFLIQYLPVITDPLGKELPTPARISRKMPRVQISKKLFLRYTIPVRVAILAHEGCHWFLNTRDQTTADLCGLKQYLDYGFPTIEAVYGVTKVFGDYPHMVGPSQVKRVETIINYIQNYKAHA